MPEKRCSECINSCQISPQNCKIKFDKYIQKMAID